MSTKRLRLDHDEILMTEISNNEFEEPPREQDEVAPFTEICTGDMYKAVKESLVEHLRSEQHGLQEVLPYAVLPDHEWPWLMGGENKKINPNLIWSVMTLLFGVFARKAVGFIDEDGDFCPVEIILPLDIRGKYTVDRLKTRPLFSHPYNPAVYKKMFAPISTLIRAYVCFLNEIGYFTEHIFAPPDYFERAFGEVAIRLLGNMNKEADPCGGLLPNLGFGIRTVGKIDRCHWAINDKILCIPDPMILQDWNQKIFIRPRQAHETPAHYEAYRQKIIDTRGDIIPKVLVRDSTDDDPAFIPSTRHFCGDLDGFSKLFDLVNSAIVYFVNLKDEGTSDEELQRWISKFSVDLLHEYCPNFMSFIGAQFFQRVCLKFQDRRFVDVNLGMPRAYFSSKTRTIDGETSFVFRDELTEDEDRIAASFLEVFGSMFFSSKTYISAFVGEGGTGKNYVRSVAVDIVGGHLHTFRVDQDMNQFSYANITDETFLIVSEDASNSQVTIPTKLMDAVLAGRRGTRQEAVCVEAKYSQSEIREMMPISVCYCRNEATDEAKTLKGKSRQEKIIATVNGVGGGRERRVRVAPPMMQQVGARGVINPIDEDNNLAFDPDNRSELPFLILTSWVTTVLGDIVRDELYGLVGEEGNPILERLNKRYLSMGMSDVSLNLGSIITAVEDVSLSASIDGRIKTIVVGSSISINDIKKEYAKRFYGQTPMKTLPEEYNNVKKRCLRCRDCGKTFSSTIRNVQLQDLARAILDSTTSEHKDILGESCKNDVPCFEKLHKGFMVLLGYKFISVTNN